MNAFENGSFESGQLPVRYSKWGSGSATVMTEYAYTGTYALVYSGQGAIEFPVSGLQSNTEYKVAVYAKLGTSAGATLGVKEHNGAEESYIPIQGTTYGLYEVSFQTGAVETSAKVYLYNESGSGTVYADDFELLVEVLPPPVINENIVDNSIYPLSDSDNVRSWKYSLDYSDEFGGAALDTNKWNDHHTYWLGRQPSIFSPRNIRQENGQLILTAKYETIPEMAEANAKLGPNSPQYEKYTTAAVQSKTKTGYGYYEIKAKAAPVSITSSFWLQGNETEIDVYETVGRSTVNPDSGYEMPMNTHYYAGGDWTKDISNPGVYHSKDDLTADFHVYGLDWNAKWIRFYYDGVLVREIRNDVFHENQYIFMDMETFTWAGLPSEASMASPNGEYVIEYVRVWRSNEPVSDEPEMELPPVKEAEALRGTPALNASSPDPLWSQAKEIGSLRVKGGSTSITAIAKTLWDDRFLYIRTEVKDADLTGTEPNETYKNDSVEVYVDGGNEKAKPYDGNDIKWNVDYMGRSSGINVPEGAQQSVHRTNDGYVVEMAVPWMSIVRPAGSTIGFDIQVNDARQPSGVRQGYLGWNDPLDQVWQNMGMTGDLKLSSVAANVPPVYTYVPSPVPDLVKLTMNGQLISGGTVVKSLIEGQSAATVYPDRKGLLKVLNSLDEKAVVSIEVNESADIVIGQFDGSLLTALADKQAILAFETNMASYRLPVRQVIASESWKSILEQSDSGDIDLAEVQVQLRIGKPTEEEKRRVVIATDAQSLKSIGEPISFVIQVMYGTQVIELTSFDAYVERIMPLPSGLDPAQVATAVVVEPDGSVRHVPTSMVSLEGKWHASIRSLTNSMYTLVGHEVRLLDIKQSGAEEIIRRLAARTIVRGLPDGTFRPEGQITRAEFTAMLVRALGLRLESNQQPFKDVSASSWYGAYVSTAHEHQLIRGYGDHTFRPMQVLTIEEGLEMLDNAIKLTGVAAPKTQPPLQDDAPVYLTREESALWIHCLLSKYVLEVDI
ncbi:sugar-binding protein [Paenibacillus sp. B01]|uniref:sugar-binding protein n=1 Tax=Paenibacillus sp. B01 TaxID=2660554 RepID=UPI001E422D3E|nr:sugar-binding protein [Paenibacillus sp. B01]